jgi:ABC-type sugar transport system permease subunit
MPEIRKLSLVIALVLVVRGLQSFEVPAILTHGGPAFSTTTLVYVGVAYGFGEYRFGFATALTMVSFFALVLTFGVWNWLRLPKRRA